MKNKKSIYILIPLVLSIWGLVLYRFFSFSKPKDIPIVNNMDFSLKPLTLKKREPIEIDVNYRDPFLGKMYNPAKPKHKSTSNYRPKQSEPIIWPEVIYKGIVSDIKDTNKIFMVLINGKTFLMREKDIEQGIKLIKGNRNSIYLNYNGVKAQFFLEE